MTHPAPRRLSVADNHPHARRVRIRVNGMVQECVIAYDCDAGWVKRYEQRADGGFVSTRDGLAAIETVRGNVTAVIR